MEDLTAPRSMVGLHIVRLPMTDSEIGPTSDEGAPRAGSRGSLRRNNPGRYRLSRIRGGLGWRAPGRELGLKRIRPFVLSGAHSWACNKHCGEAPGPRFV